MKKLIVHSISVILLILSSYAYAQDKKMKGYRIEGNEVVFVFDKRDYTEVTRDRRREKRDFDDLDIENVVVSGEFNNWSRDKWRMVKIDENRYELRKSLHDFNDDFSWEFKFIINNQFWAEPSGNMNNAVPATSESGHPLYVYNLKMFAAYPDKDGNATFRLSGHEDARKVVLSGSFNKWDEKFFAMDKVEGGWELKLQIKPGTYEYKFIVDGEWMEDQANPQKVRNQYGSYNSVIDIKKEVTFHLQGYADAEKIILSGSFNNWSEDECRMERTDDGWKYTIWLSAGKHHYKFIVDDQWILDPVNPVKEYDKDHNVNSVCMVRK
ncbi:hypothetical protein GWK08_07960 [Leptobacterium flavescens]|uniref:AMP-activated protein kinase glycogen-binding domain-containing protein n=1 Tax=Leptobacterium flavescens TaxID=472055 RepID=A0A6P0UNB5_9FLAO|nr:hypothetical protein [Leptobacterium flavescens]NER13368.1 hypothetical protein [Leptobacterium flavescens]